MAINGTAAVLVETAAKIIPSPAAVRIYANAHASYLISTISLYRWDSRRCVNRGPIKGCLGVRSHHRIVMVDRLLHLLRLHLLLHGLKLIHLNLLRCYCIAISSCLPFRIITNYSCGGNARTSNTIGIVRHIVMVVIKIRHWRSSGTQTRPHRPILKLECA